jgi:hypothetical protein
VRPDNGGSSFSVSPSEEREAMSGPAPVVNRFFVSRSATGLRICGLEQDTAGESHFRTAMFTDATTAAALINLLSHFLNMEANIADGDPTKSH